MIMTRTKDQSDGILFAICIEVKEIDPWEDEGRKNYNADIDLES